ncbi:hypothetical protein ACFCP7_08640 [Paenibacillus elgii]
MEALFAVGIAKAINRHLLSIVLDLPIASSFRFLAKVSNKEAVQMGQPLLCLQKLA